MNPERQQAISYLQAPANGLWRWAEDGDVLVWSDGATVSFRAEIIQILQWLAPNGVPPFGAIALMLAGCRGKVPSVLSLPLSPAPATVEPSGTRAARLQLAAQLEAALVELRKLSTLPADLKTGIKAKCVLAEAIFETAKVERFIDARTVLNGMREPLSDAELNPANGSLKATNLVRQLHIVGEGLKL